jgi:hypothetical protein
MGKGSSSSGSSSGGGVKGGHAPAIQQPVRYNAHRIQVHVQHPEQPPVPDDDHEQAQARARWPKGFANVGNTCYANAALQCLLSTALSHALLDPETVPIFRRYSSNANLLAMGSGSVDSEDEILTTPNNSRKTLAEREREQQRRAMEKRRMHDNCEWLTNELTRVAEEYTVEDTASQLDASWWPAIPTLDHGIVNPESITRHPDRLSKCLVPYQQEDAHEFLRALLSTLVMNGHNKQLSSLFDGLLESSVTCRCCGRASLTRDRYMDLSLDINEPDITSLSDALEEYTKTEVLDEENSVFCQKCAKKQSVTKGLRLATAPSILVCHLKRFAFDCYGRLVRLHKKINFPLRLEIADCMSNLNKARPPPYDLMGILVHEGQTCASGHYLAFVKKQGEWFRCNDSVVTKVDVETVLNQQAYILMYEVAEMRERTCYPARSLPRYRNQTPLPYIDTTDGRLSMENFGNSSNMSVQGSIRSRPKSNPRWGEDPAARIMRFLRQAEGNLSNFLTDLCCDSTANDGFNEPKSRRRMTRKRGTQRARDDYSADCSTVSHESYPIRRSTSSSNDFHVIQMDLSDSGRAQTAPRERRLRNHSFSTSEPGASPIYMDSPHNHKSTRSEKMFGDQERASRSFFKIDKPRRERGRSEVKSSDMTTSRNDLPPLPPNTPLRRRAKSSSSPRKKIVI